MRFYLVVGSTHMGSAGPGYDQPAITTVDLCNHSRREQASEKGFIHRCGDTQSSRSRYLGCQDIFFCVYKHASVMAVYQSSTS